MIEQKKSPFSNGRGERRHSTDAQDDLRTVLDRENSLRKYRSSISSILGDTVATSLLDEDSGAAANIPEDISVRRRGDTPSKNSSSHLPVHKNHGGSGCGRIFKTDGSHIARTGRRRGDSSSAKTQSARIHKSDVNNSNACISTRDCSPSPPRNSKRCDASLAPSHKSKDDSGHACTARSHCSASVAKDTCPSVPADPPVFSYRVGDTRASLAHSAPFASPSQAAAALAALPLRSPLFARRSDQRFTYAILAERCDGEQGGATSLVIALDEGGTRKKVLERRHWQTCLRLVRTGPASDTGCDLE